MRDGFSLSSTIKGDLDPEIVRGVLCHHEETEAKYPLYHETKISREQQKFERSGGHSEMSGFDEDGNMTHYIEVHSYAVTARATVRKSK